MRSNPDAIVKFGVGRRDRDAEAETQEWGMDVEEDASWVDRRQHTTQDDTLLDNLPNPIPTWLPEALQDLPSSDDDDEPDVSDLLREARRVKERAKRREREERDRDREEGWGVVEVTEGAEVEVEVEEGKKRRMRPFPMRKERVRRSLSPVSF